MAMAMVHSYMMDMQMPHTFRFWALFKWWPTFSVLWKVLSPLQLNLFMESNQTMMSSSIYSLQDISSMPMMASKHVTVSNPSRYKELPLINVAIQMDCCFTLPIHARFIDHWIFVWKKVIILLQPSIFHMMVESLWVSMIVPPHQKGLKCFLKAHQPCGSPLLRAGQLACAAWSYPSLFHLLSGRIAKYFWYGASICYSANVWVYHSGVSTCTGGYCHPLFIFISDPFPSLMAG